MIISIDEKIAFDKIQHPLMIKTLQKVGTEGIDLSIIKVIQDKSTTNIILNGEKIESIFSKMKNKIRMFSLAIFIQHCFGIPSQAKQRRKEINRIQIWKEEVKRSLLADDMILYLKNPKDVTRKLLELITEYCKVVGYKINTQTYLTSLCTNKEI